MKGLGAVLLYFALMSYTSMPSRDSGWRGIVPLHSTRGDVERLLGPGTNECKCAYYLDDVNVFLQYSSGDCKSGGSGGWNIPADTVIRFTVVPKPRPRLSDLKINESKFRRMENGHLRDVVRYVNEEQGLLIEVYEGMVNELVYFPNAKDEHLRCP